MELDYVLSQPPHMTNMYENALQLVRLDPWKGKKG